jgi:hypothetical protein
VGVESEDGDSDGIFREGDFSADAVAAARKFGDEDVGFLDFCAEVVENFCGFGIFGVVSGSRGFESSLDVFLVLEVSEFQEFASDDFDGARVGAFAADGARKKDFSHFIF